jgi:hypothetical protein
VPTFKISIVNEHFACANDHECADVEEAQKIAIKGALDIAGEQVSSGEPFFGAEVCVSEGSKTLSRMVVAVGASPLKA